MPLFVCAIHWQVYIYNKKGKGELKLQDKNMDAF